MQHHIRAHRHVLTSKLAWTYGQTRSLGTVERHPLLTLDPKKIQSSGQYPRDISGTHEVPYTVQTRNKFVKGVIIRYTTEDRQYIPFPDNTRGFLYYNGPRLGNSDFSGSLRFRVISGSGPNSFEDGVDLRLPTGGIWQIHLYTALRSSRHTLLAWKLLEEGLVTPSIVERLRVLPHILLRGTSQILYKLEDPFVARLHSIESLVFMSENGVESGQIMALFFDTRSFINMHPYKGTVLANFERSTLPKHANTRTVVLRIVETLSPIQCMIKGYDSYITLPTPGNLLTVRRGESSSLRPWSSNLDGKGKASKMISLLWPSISGKDLNATP